MADNETISQWLVQLKQGDDHAVEELWDRYQFRQIGLRENCWATRRAARRMKKTWR